MRAGLKMMDAKGRVTETVGSALSKLSIHIRTGGGVDKYPAKDHVRRVAEKLGLDHGLIAMMATKAANWPNSDMPAPFRQDRYFYYLTGCNEPGTYVTYHIHTGTLTLWLPPIDKARVVWYGRGSTVEEALDRYDVDEARYIKVPSAPNTEAEFYALSRDAKECLRQCHSIHVQPLKNAIDACRVIKDRHEIDLIRKANDITAEAHINVLKGMHSFKNEAEVEAAYMQVCIARKAKLQAYDPIAGSGPNAAELHYSENDADFGKGQTVVLDAGCEVELYASDVTRTMPINYKNPGHWPSEEAKSIYSLVEKIQESCIKRMLPGNIFIETFRHAHELVIEGLLDLGIFKSDYSAKEIFAAGTSRAFLPHGLGHHVGLEVHDVSPVPPPPAQAEAFPTWTSPSTASSATFSTPVHTTSQPLSAPSLEPGMIVTVEPGIYFNKFLLDNFFLNDPDHVKFIDLEVLDRYMQVGGVRIEDDILITKNGYENLTTAPKGEEMLEIMRESARAAGNGRRGL